MAPGGDLLSVWDDSDAWTISTPSNYGIQATDTIGNSIEDKPPVCTNEEWENFCEEEGLTDYDYQNYGYATTGTSTFTVSG